MSALTTRFPDLHNPVKWSGFHCDFNTDEDLTEFVATAIGGGAAAVLDTGLHGVAQLAGAATTDNSGVEMQRDCQPIGLVPSRKTIYRARFRLTESTSTNVATESDTYHGISKLDTSFEASKPSDYVVLKKVDGGTSFALDVVMGSVTIGSFTGLGTLVAGTWYEFEMLFDMEETSGRGTMYAYLDDVEIARLYSQAWTMYGSQLFSTINSFQSGDSTGTKWGEVDFVAAYVARVAA